MKPLVSLLLFVGCISAPNNLEKENARLQKEVDSLQNELYKCDMLIKAYEDYPLTL